MSSQAYLDEAEAPALIALLLGRTLVTSLTTSFRISGARIRDELGWAPQRPRFREQVTATVAATSR